MNYLPAKPTETYEPVNLSLPELYEPDPSDDKVDIWLISFADILTLLLTLFVLLLALNQASQQEQAQLATNTAQKITHIAHDRAAPAAAPQYPTAPTTAQMPAFYIPQDIKDQVDIVETATEVNMIIKDNVLFGEGSASLKLAGQSVLDRIAEMLNQNDYPVSVEGHTDNIPIHTAQFPSNWELSAFRASIVTRYFIQQGVAVKRLRATGYADTQPIADNSSEEGRARNRRVSLIVHINEASNGPSDLRPK